MRAFQSHKSNSLQLLIGICAGISADGQLNDVEISYLKTWLLDNRHITAEWPANVLTSSLCRMMADGVVTDDERANLLKTIQEVSGTQFVETGASAPLSPAFPSFCYEEPLCLDSSFCLTGEFFFGSRKTCHNEIIRCGGTVSTSVSHADYLIVGLRPNPLWKHGSFGLKIEQAIRLYKKDGTPELVPEKYWVECITKHNETQSR